MTPEEALKIKLHYQYLLQDASIPELIEADNLSIEALKAWLAFEKAINEAWEGLLPGETKE